ncbi:MAG: molecular chaperone HtpG [Firmicutes bacterium]|nr:molecular chaperone HtpG [Bacillota bacterium]MCL1953869.1 molecular chaperone HtpG [Bacillota bacterium]
MSNTNKEFKAESKRLLDLMINSVYTNKEIFLRELISNSSDALDKLHFVGLTDKSINVDKDSMRIMLVANSDTRVLTVADNGIGMSLQELDSNLGTIAKSGSHAFKQNEDVKKASGQVDIIGQFGVGFYSAFMVADRVQVLSLVHGAGMAHVWESSGLDGYSIREMSLSDFETECRELSLQGNSGTIVKLYLKQDDKDSDFKYSSLLDEYTLTGIVKKYSDYIRYPIITPTTLQEDDGVEKKELKTINSQIPLWKKPKSQVSKEQYESFYSEKFFDYSPPLKYIVAKIEGTVEFDTLLFVPSVAPYDYFAKDFSKGLQLYASGVLIQDKCSELLPDYFGFVRGVVDSNDISLNISRELLQQDQQLKKISNALEKRIRTELIKLKNDDRESYNKFFEVFGVTLKFGAYDGFGANKDKLIDLLLFYSSTQKSLVDFKEYVSRMPENQKHIYYATGDSYAKLDRLPSTERVRDAGFEILYLRENIDEFCIKIIGEFDGKKLVSVSSPDLDLPQKEDDKIEDTEEDKQKNATLLQDLATGLKDKVTEVKLSNRLKTHACCLTSKGEISIEMEKVFAAMPDKSRGDIKAQKVLEINPNHRVFARLTKLHDDKSTDFGKVARVLYTTARIIEGLSVEDSVGYSEDLLDLI